MDDPQVELRQLVNGYQVTHAIHVIVELRIPDLLAGGARSAADLARAQFEELLAGAALRLVSVTATSGTLVVIEAARAS